MGTEFTLPESTAICMDMYVQPSHARHILAEQSYS